MQAYNPFSALFRNPFNLTPNKWPRKTRCVCLALLRYCVKVQEQLESNRDLNDGEKKNMKDAIEEALKAFERLDKGYQYNKDDPHDPLRQAEDRIKQFVPRTEWTPPTNDDDQNKLATAISMIREIADSAAPPSTRYSVDVKLCDSSKGSVNPISETLEYRFTGDNYTLDDLLYILRLRRPNLITDSPYLYCRQVREHQYTHEGSLFRRRKLQEPLMGLPRTEQDDIGVVYLVAPQPKFVMLVKGSRKGENDKDGFYIVHKFEEQTTDVIAECESQTRTFYHISRASPSYTCAPGVTSGITWKEHERRKQLRCYEGEWVVCVPREEEV